MSGANVNTTYSCSKTGHLLGRLDRELITEVESGTGKSWNCNREVQRESTNH